ncbi:hypothetical protein BsIDN1_70430 [Bacillus safensis]|uniref:Uncharacterized protein n=1 Tax=Bacillus safensis TaxID=561879 RepID=A0A5S9MKW8_BACIA|nr:hypothetical protein BsIDN1_70430 [Bacillus safensis]
MTEKGLNTLREWLAQPLDQLPTERNEVLLKLFFGQYLSFEKKLVFYRIMSGSFVFVMKLMFQLNKTFKSFIQMKRMRSIGCLL